MLMEKEKRLLARCRDYSATKLRSLEQTLAEHKAQVDILSRAIQNKSSAPVELSEMEQLKERLFALKHTGKTFRGIFDLSNHIAQQMAAQRDIPVDIFGRRQQW